MKRPAYPSYKASGVEWLGNVPEHWEVKRGRFCMRVNPTAGRWQRMEEAEEVSFVPMDAVGENGGLRLDVNKPLGEIGTGYTAFEDGDVVVAKITPCFENGKGALATDLTNKVAFGTTELHVLRVGPALDNRFLFYLTISTPYRKTGEAEMYGAGGQKRVPPEFNKDFRTTLPPLNEQHAIADFLDRETARLDTLVAKKRELIEKLKEKRTALISRTVTGGLPPAAADSVGLDPHGKSTPSGIEWLGDVPERWDVTRFLRCAFFQEGPGLRNWQFTDSGIRVVCVTNITEVGIDFTNYEKFISEEEYEQSYRHFTVENGDLLLSSSGNSWGKVAEYTGGDVCILNTSTIRIHKNRTGTLLPALLKWVLQSECSREQLGLFMTGSCQPNFGPSHLARVVVAVPPLPEQCVIAAYLDRETAKLDALTAKIATAIARLQEYRTALITAAVTGKIDVRGSRTGGPSPV